MKVGDTIKCVNASNYAYVTVDKEYKILDVVGKFFVVKNNIGDVERYTQSCFIAVEPAVIGTGITVSNPDTVVGVRALTHVITWIKPNEAGKFSASGTFYFPTDGSTIEEAMAKVATAQAGVVHFFVAEMKQEYVAQWSVSKYVPPKEEEPLLEF